MLLHPALVGYQHAASCPLEFPRGPVLTAGLLEQSPHPNTQHPGHMYNYIQPKLGYLIKIYATLSLSGNVVSSHVSELQK